MATLDIAPDMLQQLVLRRVAMLGNTVAGEFSQHNRPACDGSVRSTCGIALNYVGDHFCRARQTGRSELEAVARERNDFRPDINTVWDKGDPRGTRRTA